jgi:hypothetical protein
MPYQAIFEVHEGAQPLEHGHGEHRRTIRVTLRLEFEGDSVGMSDRLI